MFDNFVRYDDYIDFFLYFNKLYFCDLSYPCKTQPKFRYLRMNYGLSV